MSSQRSFKVWSDVPRRLLTICIGVPIIWKILQNPYTAYIFFLGAHALSAWEYTSLEPSPFVTNAATTKSEDADHKLHRPPLLLSYRKRFLFCGTSTLLSIIPDYYSCGQQLFLFATSLIGGLFVMTNRYHWIVGLFLLTAPFRAWLCLVIGNDIDNADPTNMFSSNSSSFASTIAVLLVVWNTDTGALLAGRLFGEIGRAHV